MTKSSVEFCHNFKSDGGNLAFRQLVALLKASQPDLELECPIKVRIRNTDEAMINNFRF